VTRDPCDAGRMRLAVALAALLLLVVDALPAAAYRVALVPASRRAAAEDIEGMLSITGADGQVRVHVEGANDRGGVPLDGELRLQMTLRVRGARRRVTLPVAVSAGDGDAATTLGLAEGTQIAVVSARVRGPDGHTLAVPGAVLVADTPAAPPPPTAGDCPDALDTCREDLDSCATDLDDCTFDLDTCENAAP
jgi:hypothetical protein